MSSDTLYLYLITIDNSFSHVVNVHYPLKLTDWYNEMTSVVYRWGKATDSHYGIAASQGRKFAEKIATMRDEHVWVIEQNDSIQDNWPAHEFRCWRFEIEANKLLVFLKAMQGQEDDYAKTLTALSEVNTYWECDICYDTFHVSEAIFSGEFGYCCWRCKMHECWECREKDPYQPSGKCGTINTNDEKTCTHCGTEKPNV